MRETLKIGSPEETPEATIPLPSWTDAQSVTSYFTSLAAVVFTVLAAVHPGYTEPGWVPAALGIVGLAVAAGVQAVNLVQHLKARTAIITAAVQSGQSFSIKKV